MVPVAYLNSEYPSLSHTFIEREIRALRAMGAHIRPFSVRPSTNTGRIGDINSAAAAETIVLQSGWASMAARIALRLVRSPLGSLRAVVAGQRLTPPGLRSRVRHLAYAAQAMILADHLRAMGINHVHVHMANNGAAIALLAAVADSSLTYSLSIHGSAEFFHVDSWTLAAKAERALFVRCISNFCKAQVMAWTDPTSWERFHIVRCGIDTAEYSPRPARASGPLRLITVGRLHPIKGYHVLLDACRILADESVSFSLEMIGDGPMRDSLQAQSLRLGLEPYVRFLGPVNPDDIPDHLNRADAIIVSSFMEGVPVVLMEAMAKELGVIATRAGGVPELVEDGASGLLVDAGCAAALADAIRAYAQTPMLCRRHGVAGRQRIIDQYRVEQTGEGMTALFAKYTGEGRIGHGSPASLPASPSLTATSAA